MYDMKNILLTTTFQIQDTNINSLVNRSSQWYCKLLIKLNNRLNPKVITNIISALKAY